MISVEVETARVSRAFLDLARRIQTGLRDSWTRVGARMVEETIPVVPTLSGALAASLKATAGMTGVDVSAGGGNVVYAGVQNFGWPAHNITGKRFMDRAEQVAETEMPDELGSEIQSFIRRVGLS